jgi:hypothetical protein
MCLLAAAAFLMPSPPEERLGTLTQTSDDPPATELLAAALSMVADVSDFCTRQASVCETAHYLAVMLEGKTKYSIELLYQWANESNDPAMTWQTLSDERDRHGRTVASRDAKGAGRNTLRLEDLIPEWRAPRRDRAGQSPS